jgi:4-hydroxy-3-polyprenylbenzoate decarboxylase
MIPIVLAITGASGAVYAVRLLQQLAALRHAVELVISPSGFEVIDHELQLGLAPIMHQGDQVRERLLNYSLDKFTAQSESVPQFAPVPDGTLRLVNVNDYNSYMSRIASGSARTRGMIICPCSGATLAGVAHAQSSNLIQRAAEVHLKERRPLILVPRETPLSTLQLENMHRLSLAGATILPAMPGWYHGVHQVLDLVDFVVARILDHLQIEHNLIRRWGADPA